MQEMNKINKYISNIHNKFMNKPRTPKDSMVADLMFSANLIKLAIWNMKRWSMTTNKPKTAWVNMLKEIIKDEKGETNVK